MFEIIGKLAIDIVIELAFIPMDVVLKPIYLFTEVVYI